MNYNIEINRLVVKYGNNPATKACLSESLSLFQSYSQDVIATLKRKANDTQP